MLPRRGIGLLAAFTLLALRALTVSHPQHALAAVLRIDSAASVVHTTNWSYWNWAQWGPPDDGVDLRIRGALDVMIERGAYDAFLNLQYPDRIQFRN